MAILTSESAVPLPDRFTSTKEGLFYQVFVCLFACLPVSRITQKDVDEF